MYFFMTEQHQDWAGQKSQSTIVIYEKNRMMGKENFVSAHFAEKFQHPFGNSFQMSPYDLDIYATQGDIYKSGVPPRYP